MAIPARLLPHTVTVVTPTTTTDVYGSTNLVYATSGPTVRTVQAYLQPEVAPEDTVDRDAVTRRWLLFSNDPVAALERVTHNGGTYEVDGEPSRWDAPDGTHHYEARTQVVEG